MKKKHHWIRNTVFIFVGLILILTLTSVFYINDYYKADSSALAALEDTDTVSVYELGDDWVFEPKSQNKGIGYIFYPGGKVEETAYAPLMQSLAERGITSILLKVPFRLAILDIDAAEGIQAKFPSINDWYVGGHSLGGASAGLYIKDHLESYDGLILMGAYTTADLSNSELRMLSIYGSQDGVLDKTSFEENKVNNPLDTSYEIIEGGNHAGFGNYGDQKNDGVATISKAEQQARTAELISSWIEN